MVDLTKEKADLGENLNQKFEIVINKLCNSGVDLFIKEIIEQNLNALRYSISVDFDQFVDKMQQKFIQETTPTSEKIVDEEPPFEQDEITFEVENKQITLPHAPNIVINATKSEFNFHHTNTSNLSKQEIINDNLKAIANLGYDYKRLSNYHVRIFTPSQPVDFYLTTERFMDAGGPTIGKGLSELIKYLKSL
nr:MAG TPA: hypothetical protein [Caudoviricetes sp.]